MADLTPEQVEDWRREAKLHHDRYLRDGTGATTVMALTQARLIRALDELSLVRYELERLKRLGNEVPASGNGTRVESERFTTAAEYRPRGLAARR